MISCLIVRTCEPAVLRPILVCLLIGILASCRLLCSTAECAHASIWTHHEEAPHPVNDDNCLCNGGLQVVDATPLLSDLDPSHLLIPIDLPFCGPGAILLPLSVPKHLVGQCEALAPWGCSSQLCALFQQFRC